MELAQVMSNRRSSTLGWWNFGFCCCRIRRIRTEYEEELTHF